MYCVSSFSIFYDLFKTRLVIMSQELLDSVINIYIWIIATLFVMGYLMQSFGLVSSYGNFQFAASVATIGLFEVYGNVVKNIMDFEGDSVISYYLTLPTKPWIVLLSMVASYAFFGIFLSFAVLPVGALLLFKTFTIMQVAWFKLIGIIIMANIFFACFTLAVAAYVNSMVRVRNVWSRFIFPMWYLGGFQFKWESLLGISSALAYSILCNPVIYIMEGTRAAMLGQEGCISWWLCMGATAIFSILCWIYAYYKMKRFLDFV